MSLFCFLWIPLFYFFWRSLAGNDTSAGEGWALLGGILIALIQLFLGPFVEPGGFGFYRWLSACIDIVVLPAVLPFLAYFLLKKSGIIKEAVNPAGFTLLWLIPGAVIRSLFWSSLNDPILLIIVPILWAAIAVGAPFFIKLIQKNSRTFVIVLSSLGILVVPSAAASSYWAFFSHKTYLGFLFLFAATAPMLVSVAFSFLNPAGRT